MDWLAGWLLLSIVAGIVAAARNRSGFGWFAVSLLISPVIGLILVIALDRRAASLPKRAATAETHRHCPHCREVIRRDARLCKHCRSAVEPTA